MRAARRHDVEALTARSKSVLELRLDLEDDPILVRRGEDIADDARAEGVVKRVVDELRRDTERAASSRSISTAMWGAAICWSDATSCSPGMLLMRCNRIGAQWFNSSRSVSVSVYWYRVRLNRPPTVMSCPACMKNLTPEICATIGRKRAMTFVGVDALRERLQLDHHPPAALGGVAAGRADEGDGARDRRILRHLGEDFRVSDAMPANDMSCRESASPKMNPVSCSGKKPFGMMT